MSDARPVDEADRGLSRIAPCPNCDHDEHLLRCLAFVDAHHEDVVCPCRGVPIPGVYA